MEDGQEKEFRASFTDSDATAMENWIFASSREIPVNGEEELVSQNSLLDIYQRDPHALKTPINVLTGERSIEEVEAARAEHKVFMGMFLTLFGANKFVEWNAEGIKPGIKLSDLNENGEVSEVRVILTKDGKTIEDLSDYVKGLELDPGYKGILKEPQAVGGEIVCGFE